MEDRGRAAIGMDARRVGRRRVRVARRCRFGAWAVFASLLLLVPTSALAQQRERGFCPLFGADLHHEPCGRDRQMVCDSGQACDPGFRALTFAAAGWSAPTVDCSPLQSETVGGSCIRCGGNGEIACAAPSFCSSGLGRATTGGLDGPISACSSLLPPDPASIPINVSAVPGFFDGVSTTIDLPPIEDFVDAYGICSTGVPVSLAGASRETWPAAEMPIPGSGTAVLLHGRGSSCGVLSGLLSSEGAGGAGVFERHQRTYCIDYDQSPGSRTVRVFEPLQQASGEGPETCSAAGTCAFDLAHPLRSFQAPSYSIPGIASAVEQAIRAIPSEGEISLIAHSQGGFVARALIHGHYDELRWKGSKISRVVTLGHPYFGMVVDPSKATPWLCARDSSLDCHVLRWLWGWQSWLGTTPGSIDQDDFPQLDWTAVGGDGGATIPGALDAGPDVPDACLAIFGGVQASSIAGDGGVSTQSSLGIDESGFFFSPIGSSLGLESSLVNCDHGSSCLLRKALEIDPELLPTAEPSSLPMPGALAFDGIDDAIGGLDPAQVAALTVTGALTLEAWIAPDAAGATGLILNKEGEYELGLIDGELSWAIANASPGWAWQGSGFFPPANEWSHVAVRYDPAGSVTVFADGTPFSTHAASGPIGDAEALDDFRIGFREREIGLPFDGRIDDVRVWKRALDGETLDAHLRGVVDADDPDLLGWWTFNEGSGPTLFDRSRSGHHLSLVALGSDAAPVRRPEDRDRAGGAMYFDGVDDFVQITDPATLAALEASGTLTIEAWLRPRGPGGAAGGVVLNKEGEYALTRLVDGRIAFSLANDVPGWVTVATNATAPAHVWTHVALVYRDGAPGSVEIYTNGTLVDSIAASGVIDDFSPTLEQLRIGGRQATANDQWFHGLLDDVRLWSVARTASEIAADYDHLLAEPLPPGLLGNWRFDQRSGALVADASAAGHHAHRGSVAASSAATPSWGPALPDHPGGLLGVPEPGLGASLVTGLLLMARAGRRRGLGPGAGLRALARIRASSPPGPPTARA